MERVSDWIVGTMVGLFGLVGLIMGVGARDEEMFIFGFSLAIFGGLFVWNIYQRQKAAHVPVAVRVTAVSPGGHNG